jgi:hypothetical protein
VYRKMNHQTSPPASTHGEPKRVVQALDEAETARVDRVRQMRQRNGNISTYRAKGLSWYSVFFVIANRMIGTLPYFGTFDLVLTVVRYRHL